MSSSIILMADSFVTQQPIPRHRHHHHHHHQRSTRLFSLETEIDHVDASVLMEGLQAGLDKMDKLQDLKFWNSQSSQLKTLNSQIVKSLEVKKSSIPGAGLGLFASKNIKAGSIVSFYPAHTLGIEHGDEFLFVSNTDQNREYFQQHPPDTSSYLHATDQPIFNRPSFMSSIPEIKEAPVYLDVNPNVPVSPAWVSHYINDGATLRENSIAGVEDYYRNSKASKNCIHVPFGPSPIMATVATKKIKKGQELFTSYGCVYWIGVQYRDEDSAPMTKEIQEQIKESAQDLFAAMNVVSTRYQTATQALEEVFREI